MGIPGPGSWDTHGRGKEEWRPLVNVSALVNEVKKDQRQTHRGRRSQRSRRQLWGQGLTFL